MNPTPNTNTSTKSKDSMQNTSPLFVILRMTQMVGAGIILFASLWRIA